MNIRMPDRPKKKAVNLSIDAGLLKEARAQGLNLSAVLERALVRETTAQWLAENRAAVKAYNRSIETRGVWSDGWRRW